MPTNAQRVSGILISAAITIGGAWLASQVPSTPATAAKATTTQMVDKNAPVALTVANVRNDKGKIIVMIFDNATAFKNYDVNNAVAYREVNAKHGALKLTFPKLTKGPYAIAAFHDENGDKDLNMNGSVPTEGYATSGADNAYDTPSFSKAAKKGNVTLKMHYLK